jgi:hypothetical protein
MVGLAKEVGPQRYRESYGRYFEDFVIGDVYEHRPGRTISEADNTWFTLLTMNQPRCISMPPMRPGASSASSWSTAASRSPWSPA